MDILQRVENWHKDARPVVTDDNLRMALAVHIEEFLEMLDAVGFEVVSEEWKDKGGTIGRRIGEVEGVLWLLMKALKDNKLKPFIVESKRNAFLDGLADQIVTAVGCGVAAGMNVPEAVNRVQISNDSKRCPDTGKFFFDEQGKITKPDWYQRPDLMGLY